MQHNKSLKEIRDDVTERSHFRLPKNAEDAIVPAHNMKKPIDFNTVGEDQYNGGANTQ